MPCYDPRNEPGWEERERLRQEHRADMQAVHRKLDATANVLKWFEAALCGVLSVDEGVLDRVDWTEAGIPRLEVEAWWKQHKEQDEKRRAGE